MSRAVVQESFGGPEVLEVREVPELHAGPDEVRIRVAAAGLNPVDWMVAGSADLARAFGVTLPAGFGSDVAGTIDEVGENVRGFAVGDRVFGGARGCAVADQAVVRPGTDVLHRTPDGVDDRTASTLPIAGSTADAAIAAVRPGAGETILVGGAAGGVGIFAVQLARRAGARVLGTGSPASSAFLRELGAEPVVYGEGLVERVRKIAPEGISAAIDLFGTETALAALELGVPASRIATIATHEPPAGVHAVGGRDATPGALDRLAAAIAAHELTVPIAAVFPIERIRAAVELQRGRHVHGKVVVTL